MRRETWKELLEGLAQPWVSQHLHRLSAATATAEWNMPHSCQAEKQETANRISRQLTSIPFRLLLILQVFHAVGNRQSTYQVGVDEVELVDDPNWFLK